MAKRSKKNQKLKVNKLNLVYFGTLVLVAVIIVIVAWIAKIQITDFPSTYQPFKYKTLTKPQIRLDDKIVKKATDSANIIPQQYGRSIRVPILTYHYIGNNPNPADKARDNLSVSPVEFEKEMEYLSKNGYSAVSLDTMYAALYNKASLPAKPIILTFDDGYIDFYVNAFPILRRFNLHAVSFIPTGLIGQGYYMSWNQIKEIDATGLISFQAHSVYHGNLTALPQDALISELKTSKSVLEGQLGKPVNFMAYPMGISNQTVWEATKQAGFLGAVGTYSGDTISEGTFYNMPRIKIPGGISIEDFAKRI